MTEQLMKEVPHIENLLITWSNGLGSKGKQQVDRIIQHRQDMVRLLLFLMYLSFSPSILVMAT